MLLRRSTVSLLLVFLASAIFAGSTLAQNGVTAEDAIALAAAHPAFAFALDARPGWTAAAFNPNTSHGVWRVQFWVNDGEDLGYADVIPERNRVYYFETYFGATESQRDAAYDVVREFVIYNDEVLALLPDAADRDIWIDYNGWNQSWGAYISAGADSLWVLVDFEGDDPTTFTNPQLDAIGFELPSYEEWYAQTEDAAIGIAYQASDVAAALREHDNWYASAAPAEDGVLWSVEFYADDALIARSLVDVQAGVLADTTSSSSPQAMTDARHVRYVVGTVMNRRHM